MLDVLQGFVHELRLAGLPVSMTENLDAMRAVEHVPLEDRDAFKTALGATLVKHHGHRKVFETVFEVYFSIFSPGVDGRRGRRAGGADAQADFDAAAATRWTRAARWASCPTRSSPRCSSTRSMNMDTEQLRTLAGAAVARFAGMEPGRPVGGAYYLYRTLRQLDAEGLVGKMMEQAAAGRRRSARARSTSGSRARSSRAGSRS